MTYSQCQYFPKRMNNVSYSSHAGFSYYTSMFSDLQLWF